jgi:peptidoglycan/LPS O-acetylase OafA/YrhL
MSKAKQTRIWVSDKESWYFSTFEAGEAIDEDGLMRQKEARATRFRATSVAALAPDAAYRPDIDFLRAIAVLSVIGFHWQTGVFSGGYIGVDIFFVISGFLITRMIHVDATAGVFSFVSFYERRIRRIIPALYAMIVVTAALALFVLLPADYVSFSRSAVSVIVFASNIWFWHNSGYFDAPSTEKPLLHTWSLSVEEQFYLLFPCVIYLLARYARQREVIWLAAAAAASLAFSIYAVRVAPSAAFYFAPSRAWEFLIGSVLAVGELRAPKQRAVRGLVIACAIFSILLPIFIFTDKTPFPGAYAIIPCLGTALFVWAHSNAQASKLVRAPITLFFGKISYSLYLWHWPAFVLAVMYKGDGLTNPDKLLLFGATVVISYLSFRYVEQPVRRREVVVTRRGLFAITSLASLLLLTIGAAGVVSNGFPQRLDSGVATLAEFKNYNYHELYHYRTCFLGVDQPFDQFRIENCGPKLSSPNSALLWGDSLAAHYIHGLRHFASKAGINIVQATAGACAPIFDFDVGVLNRNCSAFDDGIRSIIYSEKPAAVIISASWTAYTPLFGPDVFFDALRQTVLDIRKSGTLIFLFGPSIFYRQSLLDLLTPVTGLKRFDSSKYLEPAIFDIDERMSRKFAGIEGVYFISILKSVCSGASCPPLVGGKVPMQWDNAHLTAEGSIFVVGKIFPIIAAHLLPR